MPEKLCLGLKKGRSDNRGIEGYPGTVMGKERPTHSGAGPRVMWLSSGDVADLG